MLFSVDTIYYVIYVICMILLVGPHRDLLDEIMTAVRNVGLRGETNMMHQCVVYHVMSWVGFLF